MIISTFLLRFLLWLYFIPEKSSFPFTKQAE